MSQTAAATGYRVFANEVSRPFLALAVLLPLAAGVVAVAWRQPSALNLVHVVAGAAWAGATLYLAGVLAPTLLDLDDMVGAQVTLPLIPKHVLLFTSLALVTLVTGVGLAVATGRDHAAPVMVAAYIVGVALLGLLHYLVRLQGQIYGEVHGSEPDMDRVGVLAGRLGKVSVAAAGLQVVALVVMAVVRFA